MIALDPDDVRLLRLASLLLAGEADAPTTPLEVVRWFGAMQGQDLASLQWSFGARWPGSTVADVDAAFERGEILRTWPMRGTIHAVAAEDARWMLELCGERALAGVERRRERLGLTEAMVHDGAEVLRSGLEGGRRLTRSACVELLADAGLATEAGHGYHHLWFSSQIGVTCIGPQQGKEQTFALLDEWAPDQRDLTREQSLAEIARRFVRSHGPVTRQELGGWTGLTQGDAKQAIALLGAEVATVEVDGTPMVVSAELLDRRAELVGAHDPARVLLLPGFDEIALGYKDRSLFVDDAHRDRIIPGNNGMFRSTIVVDGRAAGTWTRTIKRAAVVVEAEPFGRTNAAVRRAAEEAAVAYGSFLGREAEVRWP